MSLDGLVAATNDIVRLSRPPAPADLQTACQAACRELRVLARDDEFLAVVNAPPGHAPPAEVDQTFEQLDRFNTFLEEELLLLRDAGLDPSAIDVLLEHARLFRQTVRQRGNDRETIRTGIGELRDEACEMARLLTDLSSGKERRRQARDVLKRSVFVMGGAAVVIGNSTATGLGHAYAAASIAVGNALIGQGIRG